MHCNFKTLILIDLTVYVTLPCRNYYTIILMQGKFALKLALENHVASFAIKMNSIFLLALGLIIFLRMLISTITILCVQF